MRRWHSFCAWLVLLTAVPIQSAFSQSPSNDCPAEQALGGIALDKQSDLPTKAPQSQPSHSLTDDAVMPHAEFEAERFDASPEHDVYHRGQWSMSYITGFSGFNLGPAPVPFSMLPEMVRFNRVINDPRPNRFLKGSFESIIEIDTMPVVNGPASIVIGGSLLMRYNFATYKRRRLVFYGQMGGGGMYTDAYLYRRGVLSTGFEFIINWGCGCSYFLTDRLALNTELSYLHFSNSGIQLPNIGVNEIGGLIGITYYFKRRRSN